MVSYEKKLPIGSVVLLKGADHRLMIIGYLRMLNATGDRVYDYSACSFPEGITDPDQIYVFDHEDIERLIYVGFQNQEQLDFSDRLQDVLDGKI